VIQLQDRSSQRAGHDPVMNVTVLKVIGSIVRRHAKRPPE
jgi:hypothetical protein